MGALFSQFPSLYEALLGSTTTHQKCYALAALTVAVPQYLDAFNVGKACIKAA
jgi:hypothetical protein